MNKPSPKKIAESDLYPPIYDYLIQQGYVVHGEVKDCDIAAVKDGELIVVEMKRSFNATLLIQAAKRQRAADSVYIAIPRPNESPRSRNWKDLCYLVRRLELGLITVAFSGNQARVEIILHPAPFRRVQVKKTRKAIIQEIDGRHGSYNTGGSSGRKLMTAYKESAVHIACCLEKHGPLSPAQLRKLGTSPKTLSILSKNYYGWFEKIARGKYHLHTEGKTQLQDFSDLASHYRESIPESF